MTTVRVGRLTFRTLSLRESIQVSRAVDALLSRRSFLYPEAPSALVQGELAVRIRCEPPYLPQWVSIRPTGALGKRISPVRVLGPDEQERNCKEAGVGFKRSRVLE